MAERASESQARVWLQPIAYPSILGLYGFAVLTFAVASHLAGWWGVPGESIAAFQYLAPFAFFFGGLAQFLAGMWAYRARDGLATAMHGMWGAFWMGWSVLVLLIATGALPPSYPFEIAFGYWFVGLAAVTLVGAVVATTENIALAFVLHTLWIGAALLAIGLLLTTPIWETIAGWFLIVSALAAWYTGSALLVEGVLGRAVLPVGITPKAKQEPAVVPGEGEPGVAKGQ